MLNGYDEWQCDRCKVVFDPASMVLGTTEGDLCDTCYERELSRIDRPIRAGIGATGAHVGLAYYRLKDSFTATGTATGRFSTTIKEWNMEPEVQNVWAQVPKRKRRFHLNAEKRAATNWAGTMKMLRLLAPCGVQANAQALDIINAKYGI